MGRPRRPTGVRLYDASGTVLAIFLIAIGVALLVSQQAEPPRERVVVVERVVPPGHRRLPPGQWRKRVWVRVVTLTPAVAAQHRVAYRPGVLVLEVSEPGLLELRALDVVVSVDGKPVDSREKLRELVAAHDEDDEVELVVVRQGRLVALVVPAGALLREAAST